MTLIKWDPFRELSGFHGRMGWPLAGGDDALGSWSPAVDIFEKGDDLVIRAEVPGVEKNDIDVRIEDGTLVLRGERKREEEITDDNAYRLERSYGSFVRSFRLPKTVDASRIGATHSNGVLEITLPKAEESKPKRIEINAA